VERPVASQAPCPTPLLLPMLQSERLPLIKAISPAVWHHIHLNGHDTFISDGTLIDLDALVASLDLG